jgi:N-acetylneuraminate synthase
MTTGLTFIIAEAGVNHNGNPDIAFQMVDAAAEAGVDAIKFQTFRAKSLVTETAPKAAYQVKCADLEESQLEMLSRLELNQSTYHELKRYSEQVGLQFLSTAFDSESLAFLTDELGLEVLKIPSGELTNGPFLLEFARTGRQLILSTGMATLEEVRRALSVLAFGFIQSTNPTQDAFCEAFETHEGQKALKERIVLLHCTTQYPASLDSINIRAMITLRDTFGLRVGYSDHSEGVQVPCIAAALGAVIIEKHFTLDRNSPGPDHGASLEPDELKKMVDTIRSTEIILGDGEKIPLGLELKNRDVARKSLVAAKDIAKGERFSHENIAVKRPGNGRSPMDYWSLIGSRSEKAYLADEVI